jgi:alanine-synthesizing transaminase
VVVSPNLCYPKLPPHVFAVVNDMKTRLRAAQMDVVDLGMGNPDGATSWAVVNNLIEAARNPRNHRYSASRGIPRLREELVKRRANAGTGVASRDRPAII